MTPLRSHQTSSAIPPNKRLKPVCVVYGASRRTGQCGSLKRSVELLAEPDWAFVTGCSAYASSGTVEHALVWNWRRDVLQTKTEQYHRSKRSVLKPVSRSSGWSTRHSFTPERTLGWPIRILETMAFVVLPIASGNVSELKFLAKAVRKHSGTCCTRSSPGPAAAASFSK